MEEYARPSHPPGIKNKLTEVASRLQRIWLPCQLRVHWVRLHVPQHPSTACTDTCSDHVHDHVLLDYCDAGPLWDPVSSALFYHFDAASYTLTRLTSPASHAPAGANYTSFLYYTGLWGDAKYPDDAPVQEKVPYFGLTRYNAGPQGPIVKSLLRKGLLPDHPSQKKFIQKLVGVFMAVYPCCLRGWRVWVSLAVVVAVGAGLVVGAKRGIRKMVASRRTRGYDKVNVDVPLDDLETSERIPLYEDGDQGDRTGLPA